MSILELKELTKAYGKENKHLILKNINLQVKQGEFISIMGPSGSGKSTLLYTISGMDKMTTGSILFDGQELSSLSESKLAQLRLIKMGFIFQQIHLLKNQSIFDNIILSAYLAKKYSRDVINQRAMELMKKVGISNLASHDITQASGGQLQRVGICRALINHPKIIFGDEPTGALNSKTTAEIMDLLVDIHETGTAIVLVTHDVKVAMRAERVLYMIDGQITGEIKLGKYRSDRTALRMREEQLSKWLTKNDF
ncbi:ABC transporter ATP-binding protein [Niallia circulans]|uniref:ABC transporter ATP-binding protein n=1 Tax=Niallia circulans TaxID=1397 RepID=UPI00203D80C7|nr:ABC transporter ATP-binding protein [Niallia circulans]MCM2982338.1 ABC transporter ATP-binding protein [Niallia circulans]